MKKIAQWSKKTDLWPKLMKKDTLEDNDKQEAHYLLNQKQNLWIRYPKGRYIHIK